MSLFSKTAEAIHKSFIRVFHDYPFLRWLAIIALFGELSIASVNSYSFSFFVLGDLRRSGQVLGYLVAAWLVTETALKLPFGHLSDRFGRHVFIILGLFAVAGLPAAIVLVPIASINASPLSLYAIILPLRVLGGAGAAAIWPCVYAEVPDQVPRKERGAAMAVINASYAAGIASGPAVAAGVASFWIARGSGNTYYEKAPFAMAAAVAVLAAFVAFRLPKHPERPEKSEEAKGFGLPSWEKVAIIVVITSLEFFATASLGPYLAPYMKDALHITRAQVGYYLLLLGVPVALIGIPIGRLADRWPKQQTRKLALWLTALGMWGVPFAPSVWVLIGLGGIIVVGFLFGATVWSALISDIAPEGGHGTTLAVMATAQGLGAALGPIVSGYLWDISIRYPFFASASALTLAATVAVIFMRGQWVTDENPGG
jgi:MFS family permease